MSTKKNKKSQKADRIELSLKEEEELKNRIKSNNLSEDDIKIILSLISLNNWLQETLANAKMTISKLRNLFGFKKESRKKNSDKDTKKGSGSDSNDSEANEEASSDSDTSNTTENREETNQLKDNHSEEHPKGWDEGKNHGRYSVDDYHGCNTYKINFDDPTIIGGFCPECKEHNTQAKLKKEEDRSVIFLTGTPLISCDRYDRECYRCTLYDNYFVAPLPERLVEMPKYSPESITTIAIHHYFGGLPFHRLETMQKAQGVPLSDSTQYDLMSNMHENSVKPVVDVLKSHAANGEAIAYDDTSGRIIEQIIKNKHSPKDKQSVHATALMSHYQGHIIYLYSTDTNTAGKTFKNMIENRDVEQPFLTMSDALSSNFPDLDESLIIKWIICLCLSHSRRRFYQLFEKGDKDAAFVLDIIGKVYEHDRYCKDHQLTPEARLAYHQAHSQPLMEALHTWLNNLLLHKHVEPNSEMGRAIKYLLKRWEHFTQFYRIVGAILDNNPCEQAIKILIRYRKESIFYKTFLGAMVGDDMMSLIVTAYHSRVNIFDYLNALQYFQSDVERNPSAWVPWEYEKTREKLQLEMAV